MKPWNPLPPPDLEERLREDDIVDDTAPTGARVELAAWAYTPRGPARVERVDGPRGPWVVRALDGRRYRVGEAVPCLPSGDPWAPRRDMLGAGAVVRGPGAELGRRGVVVSAERREAPQPWAPEGGLVVLVAWDGDPEPSVEPLSALRVEVAAPWWPPDWGERPTTPEPEDMR